MNLMHPFFLPIMIRNQSYTFWKTTQLWKNVSIFSLSIEATPMSVKEKDFGTPVAASLVCNRLP